MARAMLGAPPVQRLPRPVLGRPKQKHMTIAAGFVCTDGVLLASDTLYSATGMGNKYGPKFWILEHGDVLVAFGGAGAEAGLLRTRDEIDRKLQPGQSRIRVVDIIDGALKKVSGKLPDDLAWKTHALVVVRVGGQSVLYENSGGSNMLSPVQQVCQCVGYGQSLGWYFARSLFRAGMSLKWARIVAAHLIRNVKDYVEDCDGDTHLIEVPHVGNASVVADQAIVADIEAYLGPISQAINAVLPDGTANDETLFARLTMVTEAINKALRSHVIQPRAGELSLQSGSTTVGFAQGMPLTLRLSPTLPPHDPEDE